MSTECSKPKFRIPLQFYLDMQHEDCSIDCCDTEIDAVICVERDIYDDPEFPHLTEATKLFYSLVDVVQINGEVVTVDMYGLFHHNEAVIREWVKDAWKPEYVELMNTDDGEWEYSLIECIGSLLSGNVGDKTAERYCNLFKQFKRVPTEGDTMVLVPARDTVSYVDATCKESTK